MEQICDGGIHRPFGAIASSHQSPRRETAPVLRAPARNNVEPQLDQINCRTSFREATDGRESDMIYVICVAALVLAAY